MIDLSDSKKKKDYIAPQMEILKMTCDGLSLLQCSSEGFTSKGCQDFEDEDGSID